MSFLGRGYGLPRRCAPRNDSRGGPLRSRWRRRSLTDAAYPLRVLCRPAMTTASTILTLIRHGLRRATFPQGKAFCFLPRETV